MSEHLGIHDSLPFKQYLKADGISRSALLDIHPPSTPAHYRARHIDKLKSEEDTPALKMGRFAHLMLTPDPLSDLVVQPETIDIPTKRIEKLKSVEICGLGDGGDETCVRWNSRLAECEQWRAEQTKEIITADQWRDLHGMWESVRNHELAGKLLRLSDCERSAFAKDPDSGLLLKARFDGVPRDSNIIWDLKSCESADEESAGKFVATYRGWFQAAFYLHVANLIGLQREIFYFVMVEKAPPYAVAVYRVDPYHLEAADRIVKNDLQRLAECYASDKWPAYAPGAQILTLPQWAVKAEGLEQVA
jgi:hypothetical protein